MENILNQLLAGVLQIQNDINTLKADVAKIKAHYDFMDTPIEKKLTKKEKLMAELDEMRRQAHINAVKKAK